MKIIVDNEEQKREVLYWITQALCPYRLCMGESRAAYGCDYDCDKCWEEAGLEVVLKEDEPKIAYLCD